MFWFLISNDNITFKLQFSEKLHEYNEAAEEAGVAEMTYPEYRAEKAGSCLMGAAIYAAVWVASVITVKVGGRRR